MTDAGEDLTCLDTASKPLHAWTLLASRAPGIKQSRYSSTSTGCLGLYVGTTERGRAAGRS